jgi:hypothetical protein
VKQVDLGTSDPDSNSVSGPSTSLIQANVKRAAILRLLAERGWISLNQFAQLLGVSYPTALRMKTSYKVKTILVGGVHRIYVEEYNRFQREGNANASANTGHSPPLVRSA